MSEANLAASRRVIEDGFNKGDLSVVDEVSGCQTVDGFRHTVTVAVIDNRHARAAALGFTKSILEVVDESSASGLGRVAIRVIGVGGQAIVGIIREALVV